MTLWAIVPPLAVDARITEALSGEDVLVVRNVAPNLMDHGGELGQHGHPAFP